MDPTAIHGWRRCRWLISRRSEPCFAISRRSAISEAPAPIGQKAQPPAAGVSCGSAAPSVHASSLIRCCGNVDKRCKFAAQNKGAGLQPPRSHTAATDLKPAASARRVFFLPLPGSAWSRFGPCFWGAAAASVKIWPSIAVQTFFEGPEGYCSLLKSSGFAVAPRSKASTRAGL